MKPPSKLSRILIVGACLTAIQTFALSYTVNLQAGFNLLGNHLDNPNNDLNTILGPSAGAIPAGSLVAKWQNGGNFNTPWQFSTYNGTTWSSDFSFAPGEAVFLEVPNAMTLTFSGSAATLNLPDNVGTVGDGTLWAYSDQHLPASTSDYVSIIGANPQPGECMYLWNGNSFVEYDYDEFDSTWSYAPDPINGPPVPRGGAIFVGCDGIPPVPEPSAGLFALAFGATVILVRRSRFWRQN